jgi:cell division septation protein DedD
MSANRPYDVDDLREGYSGRRADPEPADREISLGTPTILGIFFALALALGAVFGLGYTLGRRSTQPAAELTDPTLAPSLGSASKPSAGSSGQPAYSAPPASDAPAPSAPVQTATVPLNPPAATAPPTPTAVAVKPSVPAPQPAAGNPQAAGSYVVQVAAVSSQDVADILTSSLQKKGYTVAVRHEPQDKLLHVQIGPFADKKEAEAMRARVLADGFNAIVK